MGPNTGLALPWCTSLSAQAVNVLSPKYSIHYGVLEYHRNGEERLTSRRHIVQRKYERNAMLDIHYDLNYVKIMSYRKRVGKYVPKINREYLLSGGM